VAEFTIKKEELLAPLLMVAGAVDKKQSLAILSNFLFRIHENILYLTATDLEIEISAQVPCDADFSGEITVPAKKFIDILRSLDEQSQPRFLVQDNILTIKYGRSSFKLTTLPAASYPISEDECNEVELTIARGVLLQLLQSTHFAMSQQDVRVFLNGLYLDFTPNQIAAVATDGHRMAISRYSCEHTSDRKLLVPKKGVQELLRLLNAIDDEQVLLTAGRSHFKVVSKQFTFISKLIEARFPPYAKAIPRNQDKNLLIDGGILKKALQRIVILANEKSRAVLLHVQSGQLTLIANNNEQEEAMESLSAQTEGEELKIGLNANYLLDVLSHFGEGTVRMSLSNTDSSILVESLAHDGYMYIIMPMKI